MLAVMGVTGVGKTSFINVASGGQRVWGTGLESSTSRIEKRAPILRDGYEITLVDCPGFDNNDIADITILEQLVEFLKEMAETGEGTYLTGILYLHRITDVRMTSSAAKNIQLLQALCGDEFLSKVTFVTTMWDDVQLNVGESREYELQNEYWAEFLSRSARLARYWGRREDTDYIIANYLGDDPSLAVRPNLENQMLRESRALQESDAGRLALEKLQERVLQNERQLEDERNLGWSMPSDQEREAAIERDKGLLHRYLTGRVISVGGRTGQNTNNRPTGSRSRHSSGRQATTSAAPVSVHGAGYPDWNIGSALEAPMHFANPQLSSDQTPMYQKYPSTLTDGSLDDGRDQHEDDIEIEDDYGYREMNIDPYEYDGRPHPSGSNSEPHQHF